MGSVPGSHDEVVLLSIIFFLLGLPALEYYVNYSADTLELPYTIVIQIRSLSFLSYTISITPDRKYTQCLLIQSSSLPQGQLPILYRHSTQ